MRGHREPKAQQLPEFSPVSTLEKDAKSKAASGSFETADKTNIQTPKSTTFTTKLDAKLAKQRLLDIAGFQDEAHNNEVGNSSR